MTKFPAVSGTGEVFFKEVTLTSYPVEGHEYRLWPDDDGVDPKKLYLDSLFFASSDTSLAAAAAVRAGPMRFGFLTLGFRENESVWGSSLGLATLVELYAPGKYSDIAFTGYISSNDGDGCSRRVHDVSSIDKKIKAAVRGQIFLIVPYSSAIKEVINSNIGHRVLCANSVISRDVPHVPVLGCAYTALEAIELANWYDRNVRRT